MIQAQIHHGRVEVQEPIPESWEGQIINLVPLTPDAPSPDLEDRLTALHRLGPPEFEPGERDQIAAPARQGFWETQFGALKGDSHLDGVLRDIHRHRGRPMTEET